MIFENVFFLKIRTSKVSDEHYYISNSVFWVESELYIPYPRRIKNTSTQREFFCFTYIDSLGLKKDLIDSNIKFIQNHHAKAGKHLVLW